MAGLRRKGQLFLSFPVAEICILWPPTRCSPQKGFSEPNFRNNISLPAWWQVMRSTLFMGRRILVYVLDFTWCILCFLRTTCIHVYVYTSCQYMTMCVYIQRSRNKRLAVFAASVFDIYRQGFSRKAMCQSPARLYERAFFSRFNLRSR